jgi:putative transposase
MPRLARLTVAGELHLVVQRGLPGRRLFHDDVDRSTFVAALRDEGAVREVAVHAYALLEDQVMWLATPDTAAALGLTVQGAGRRFVATVNRRHGLRGTCWEGRFRSAVVDGHALAVDLAVLIEQEPVRAGLVAGAPNWPWSSAAHHLGTARATWLREHPAIWRLGNTPFEREAAYASRLAQPGNAELRDAALRAVARGWALGSEAFVRRLSQRPLARALRPRPHGRPRA